jgi:hypothetical protein
LSQHKPEGPGVIVAVGPGVDVSWDDAVELGVVA